MSNKRIGRSSAVEANKPKLHRRHTGRIHVDFFDFLEPATAVLDKPPHPAPLLLTKLVLVMTTILIVWGYLGELDIVAVAPGRVIVSEKTKQMQPYEAGSVKAIHVREGDQVNVGTLMFELDDTAQAAELRKIDAELRTAKDEKLIAEILLTVCNRRNRVGENAVVVPMSASPDVTTRAVSEWSDIKAKANRIDSEIAVGQAQEATAKTLIARHNAILPIIKKREDDVAGLANLGFTSLHSTLQLKKERVELERDLLTQEAKIEEVTQLVNEKKIGLDAYWTETTHALKQRVYQSTLMIESLLLRLNVAKHRLHQTKIYSPVVGKVQQLASSTIGSVAGAGQILAVVVPSNSKVSVEADLDGGDVGFVKAGQKVFVKLDSFPYTKFGTIPGTLTSVSLAGIPDSNGSLKFRLLVELEKGYISLPGGDIPLSAGMTLQTEILTGKRKIKDYFIDPTIKQINDSLRER